MAKKFKGDKPTMEEIRRLKKPNEKKVPILLDSELGSAITEKHRELDKLKANSMRGNRSLADPTKKQIAALEEEIDQLEEQAEEVTVVFTFRDIGRKKYDDLVGAHKPSAEQKKEYKENGGQGVLAYDPETFVPALISACASDPEIPLEEAEQIAEEWGEGDIEALFFGAMAACKERTSVPLSKKDTEMTRISPSNSTTAPSEESDTPSS
jgi:hypothetical protein